ncbi:MAG TPA: L-threonylcarbamoyladenylate synthase [Solirubrobacteraceae bacterium]|nr:L-threonylcarbamoyladenylate synthase [Solirubrobacteraceae bacterium]
MSEILTVGDDHRAGTIARAAAALGRGELVVVPTDTVYGLAADAFSPRATARVFATKERSRRYPLPVLVHGPKQLLGLADEVPPAAERLMARYWPGPLTLVLRAQDGVAWDIGENEGTVAVRMPFDDVCLEIIRAVGPLACTSANRSGQPPATTAAEARAALGDGVALYVDAGPRTGHAPSTIVDLTRSEPFLARDGDLPADEVMAVARGDDDATPDAERAS